MFVARLALTLACVFLPNSIAAQVPVPMASQPDLTYTEDFFFTEFWENNFASGIGANRFSSVLVTSAGAIPNGRTITHSTDFFNSGVPRYPVMVCKKGALQATRSERSFFMLEARRVRSRRSR